MGEALYKKKHHMFLTGVALFYLLFCLLNFAFRVSLFPQPIQSYLEDLGTLSSFFSPEARQAEVSVTEAGEQENRLSSLSLYDRDEAVPETAEQKETEDKVDGREYTYTELSLPGVLVTEASAVRSGPDITFDAVGWLANGEEVSVIAECEETGWYRFSYKGEPGYVSYEFVEEIK